ncbi:MAG: hypothetical protein H6722_19365 [Sandaracinus sp.]|nr:hypothetical protein [Sandaracinus sp.]MCB9620376.1 hypothetical protein [Sandaracinus sp.]
MRRVSWLVVLVAAACGGEPATDLERSCRGRAVTNCLPYELAEIVEASATPSDIRVGDAAAELTVRLAFDRCPDLDANHEVTMQLRDGEQLQDLATLNDDGLDGDTMAGDGLIEKTIGNPFIGPMIPAGRTVQLRFQTRVRPVCDGSECIGGTCRSEAFEIDYRLGSRFTPL